MKKTLITIATIVAVIAVIFTIGLATVNHYNKGICPNCHIAFSEEKIFSNRTSFTHYHCTECGYHGDVADFLK